MIVADTNLVAYLLIEGERTGLARSVWERDEQWMLPTLWRSEFLNVLTVSVRSEVLSHDEALAAWHLALTTFHAREHEPSGQDVFEIAIERALSAYDAQFVATAIDLGVVLVTSDRRMLKACPDIAVGPEDFVR